MTEIILLIMGCSLALLFFIWLVFGRRIASKTVVLLMDISLVALCAATIVCGLLLRQEKYKESGTQPFTQTTIEIHSKMSQQTNPSNTKTNEKPATRMHRQEATI